MFVILFTSEFPVSSIKHTMLAFEPLIQRFLIILFFLVATISPYLFWCIILVNKIWGEWNRWWGGRMHVAYRRAVRIHVITSTTPSPSKFEPFPYSILPSYLKLVSHLSPLQQFQSLYSAPETYYVIIYLYYGANITAVLSTQRWWYSSKCVISTWRASASLCLRRYCIHFSF